MPDDLKQRPRGNEYDDEASWYKGSGSDDPNGDLMNTSLDDLDNLPTAGDDDLPEGHPSTKRKSMDGDDLKGAEASAGEGKDKSGAKALGGEEDKVGRGFTGGGVAVDALTSNTPTGRLAKALMTAKKNKGKSAGIGGLAVTIIIILMSFLGSSFELIHVRENLLGSSPFSRAQNSSLKRRQGKMVAAVIKKMSKPNFKATMGNERFADTFRKNGFDVEFNSDGTLTRFGYKGKDFDLNTTNTKTFKAATSEFFDGEIGREISGKIDETLNAKTSLFRGSSSTKLYRRLGTGLQNWVDAGRIRAGPDATDAELQTQVISDMAANDGSATNTVTEGGVRKTDAEIAAEENKQLGPDGKPLADDQRLISSATDAPDGASPTLSTLDEATNGLNEATRRAALEGTEEAASGLVDTAVKAGIKGSLTSAAKSFLSPTEVANLGCKLKGAAQYVGSLRNVLLAYELGKLSIRFMSAADHNKSGILTGGGLAILMKYLHSGNGYMSDGGLRYHMGQASARPSSAAAGMFGLSRKPRGTVGVFLAYIDKLGVAKGCKVVTNGWFQVGQAVVMAAIAIPTGGAFSLSAAAGQAVPIAILGAGIEIALQIGTNIAAKAVKQQVLSGIQEEKGDIAGGAWGAGFGSQMAMTGSSLGNIISTKPEAAYLRDLAQDDKEYAMSQTSIFDRYFNIDQPSSLASKVAFGTITSRYDLPSLPTRAFSGVAGLLVSPFNALTAGGYAAANEFGCDDPQLTKYNIETDPYCSPLVATAPDVDLEVAETVMQSNGMIDGQGRPVPGSDYEKFISYCMSGRTGMLYVEKVDKNGGGEDADDTCIGANLESLGYTQPEDFELHTTPDGRPWLARVFSPRADAAVTETVTRVPTTIEYYSAWYGYMNDLDNLTQTITGDFDSGGDSAVPAQANNSLYIIGDSLTAGMQNLDSTKNYLGNSLTSRGWAPTVNAQGCRGVYQPQGAIIGDGKSCPAGTIIDAHTVVDSASNKAAIASSGTVLISLGTNGTETNIDEFKLKSGELIDKIYTISPEARIVWLNVRLRTNGTKQTNYNQVMADLVATKRISLLDWDTYVTSVNGDTDKTNDVTWPSNDGTHHDTNGYMKKVAYIIDALGPAPSATSPTSTSPVNCQAAVGNQKIICAAQQYQGIRYAFTTNQQLKTNYNVTFSGVPGGMMRGGANAETWLKNRVVGGDTDFVECSGFTNLSMFVAFGYKTTAGCSGAYAQDGNNDGFADADRNLKIVPIDQIQPGDFLTVSKVCQTANSRGHIAIYVGKTANGGYRTIESSAGKNVQGNIYSGFYERSAGFFLHASRYVGPGSTP